MRQALDALNAPKPVRIAARVLGIPFRFLGYKGDTSQPPVLRALTALGPAYIKFGQLLSTRADIVGDALADELSVLQDAMSNFSMETAIQTIEAELDAPVAELFAKLDDSAADGIEEGGAAARHGGGCTGVARGGGSGGG